MIIDRKIYRHSITWFILNVTIRYHTIPIKQMTNLTLQSRVCSIFCSLNLSNSPSARTLSANNLRRRHLRLSLQDGQYEQLTLLCPPCHPPVGHQPLAAVHQVSDISVLCPLPVLAAHHRLQVGGVSSLAVHTYADHIPGLAQSADTFWCKIV